VALLTDGGFMGVAFDLGDIFPQSLKDHRARVEALPGVKEWVTKRGPEKF
jgi:hypothetical protein